jgi:two-component system cell cycle response regulator
MATANPYYPDRNQSDRETGEHMIRLANVLIVDGNSSRAASLKERMAKGGYHASLAGDFSDGTKLARSEHPDLILIGEPTGVDAVAFGLGLKKDPVTSDIPVVVYADQPDAALCTRAVDANLDDVLAYGCDDTELYSRMRPLVRLATMHSELRQRAETARRFGIQARDRVDGSEAGQMPAILVVGDNSASVCQTLDGVGEITRCQSLFEAEDVLGKRNFDAAILAFSEEPEGVLAFCTQVRNNPRLFNLPMVLLAGLATDPVDAYRRGATRVLRRPVDGEILRSAVVTLVRRQQLRWSVRGALNDSLQGATKDDLTGAYGRAFLDSYLENRIKAAQAQGRHLSVVVFSAPNIDEVRRQFGEDAALHLTQQLAQWITGLLRAEDITAAYKANEFCVVLPDTPLSEAEIVMHRIAGVLAYTDFAVRDVYQPVKVWVQVGSTDIRDDDDLSSVLARARNPQQ